MAIELNKAHNECTVDLDISSLTADNEIVVNLSWNPRPKGIFKFLKRPLDLDLGCFYKLTNGKQMLIDALQFSHGRGGQRDEYSRQGCYTEPPFIWHTGDDRGRTIHPGENLVINPIGVPMIEKMMIYGFIYGSATRWNESEAAVSIIIPGEETVRIMLDSSDDDHNFCAIAELDFSTPGKLHIRRLATYHDGHAGCDAAYNWNFHYTPGTKD